MRDAEAAAPVSCGGEAPGRRWPGRPPLTEGRGGARAAADRGQSSRCLGEGMGTVPRHELQIGEGRWWEDRPREAGRTPRGLGFVRACAGSGDFEQRPGRVWLRLCGDPHALCSVRGGWRGKRRDRSRRGLCWGFSQDPAVRGWRGRGCRWSHGCRWRSPGSECTCTTLPAGLADALPETGVAKVPRPGSEHWEE